MPGLPPSKKAWPDSALLAWSLAAAAFVVAAFCLASLTWDGSYYLLQTLQDGAPMVPHRRWINWALLQPVLWARPMASAPVELAVIHGLMCSLLPLLSLAACLLMLRGEYARLRFWAVLGILLAPLPGQIVLVGEVTPALQLGWVCLAFVWRGCPLRWAFVAAFATFAMWGLHPVAAPLFFYAAATSATLGFAVKERQTRRRFWTWAALFGLASLAKAAETLLLASDYERANLHGNAWVSECATGLLMTPFAALIPVLIEAVCSFRDSARDASRHSRRSTLLWGAAFVLGIAYTVYPGGWTGSLCYRKFGIFFATPLAFMAGAEALRHWRGGGSIPARSLLRPALLFALMMAGMSFSWKFLCGSLMEHLAAHPGPVQMHTELPPLERDSALNHWSTTSLSLILQGWNPEKVHVWDWDRQQAKSRLCICPEDACRWEDHSFKLAWLAKLALPGDFKDKP